MRVGVQLLGLDSTVRDALSSHLSENWNPAQVVVSPGSPPGGELDGLLVVSDGRAVPPSDAPITESVLVAPGGLGSSLEDILFQVDAKLGRLTKSYLAGQSAKSFLTRGAQLSRRELLFGARTGFHRYSNLPAVFEDSCEAKYGCSKCVDVCPTKAIRSGSGSITVSETDCTSCGICAAACPVGAIQMPEFSEAAFLGMLDKIDQSAAPKKTLVLTCDEGAVNRQPWMVVEKVAGVGLVGTRQLAAAAASSLGGVAVVCPDGKCVGKDSAQSAVEAVSGALAPEASPPFMVFLEGTEGTERLAELHDSSKARAPRVPGSGDKWKDYVAVLESLSAADSPSTGLGLTKLVVSESCTLCGACAKSCPHESLRLDNRSLFFDSALCTGCGACAKLCPEHSITLSTASGKMSQVLKNDKVYEDELVSCTRCGAPIGSVKFVAKVSSLLGPDNALVRYCQSCKQQVIMDGIKGGIKYD